MSSYSKDVCIIHLNEKTHLPGLQKRILNAFLKGIMCFQLKFHYRDGRRVSRLFEDRVALPADADEACALEMAEFQYQRFLNTIAKCLISQ